LAWLERYEPKCAAEVCAHQDKIEDFLAIKRYPEECRQVFSSRRWGIVGDAGVFLDPFYSPGSDYIALANTYLCELIRRHLAGQPILVHAPAFQYLFRRFLQGGTLIFRDQVPDLRQSPGHAGEDRLGLDDLLDGDQPPSSCTTAPANCQCSVATSPVSTASIS